MKKILSLFTLLLFTIVLKAQISGAYYVVDYSQALICGVDEETFAVIETDWEKDKPEISGGIIQGLMDRLGSLIPFKKKSSNTVTVVVKKITEKGKFNCDIMLRDENGIIQAQANNIGCTNGGKWGSKLHLMKESTRKEGRNLGSALKTAIKNKKSQ